MFDTNTTNDAARPREIAISQDGLELQILWPDNSKASFAALQLWQSCPSAAGRRRRIDGTNTPGVADLRLTSFQSIGHYAINIAFSDGHDRGVYPWSLLQSLARQKKMDDFLLPPLEADLRPGAPDKTTKINQQGYDHANG